jgi:hypothetical protein
MYFEFADYEAESFKSSKVYHLKLKQIKKKFDEIIKEKTTYL